MKKEDKPLRKFIELHHNDTGTPVLINVYNILCVSKNSDGSCWINTNTPAVLRKFHEDYMMEPDCIHPSETYDEVCALLKQTEI